VIINAYTIVYEPIYFELLFHPVSETGRVFVCGEYFRGYKQHFPVPVESKSGSVSPAPSTSPSSASQGLPPNFIELFNSSTLSALTLPLRGPIGKVFGNYFTLVLFQ
jgi:hypothetical protein